MTEKKWRDAFATVLIRRMEELELSQGDLASKVGCSQSAVCTWMGRKRTINSYYLMRVCCVLGLNFDDLPALSLFDWQRA